MERKRKGKKREEKERPELGVSLPAMRLEHRRRWPVEGVGWVGWVRSPDEEKKKKRKEEK